MVGYYVRALGNTFSIVSVAARAARRARVRHAFAKEAVMCLLHLERLKFATHTAARRKAAFVDLEE